MSSFHASAVIGMKNGERHECCEYPSQVMARMNEAAIKAQEVGFGADRVFLELERPVTPREKFWLNVDEIASVKGV